MSLGDGTKCKTCFGGPRMILHAHSHFILSDFHCTNSRSRPLQRKSFQKNTFYVAFDQNFCTLDKYILVQRSAMDCSSDVQWQPCLPLTIQFVEPIPSSHATEQLGAIQTTSSHTNSALLQLIWYFRFTIIMHNKHKHWTGRLCWLECNSLWSCCIAIIVQEVILVKKVITVTEVKIVKEECSIASHDSCSNGFVWARGSKVDGWCRICQRRGSACKASVTDAPNQCNGWLNHQLKVLSQCLLAGCSNVQSSSASEQPFLEKAIMFHCTGHVFGETLKLWPPWTKAICSFPSQIQIWGGKRHKK